MSAEIRAEEELARRERVNAVWSAPPVEGSYWLAHPAVRERVNRLASGRPDLDAYGRLAEVMAQRGARLPIRRALSIGCGQGGVERDLLTRGLVERFEALDLAEGAVAEARRLAEEAGLSARLRYRVADLEEADLPPASFDAVIAHSAVHHIERLEALFEAVRRALRPGGVFHLYEFVGPNRFQWTEAQLRLGNEALDALPERFRRLPSGHPKGRLIRPSISEMLASDPTEAVRSSEILTVLPRYFEVVEVRPLGGAVLHNVLGDVVANFRPGHPEDDAVLERVFAVEDEGLARGEVGSDFATATAVLPAEDRSARGLPDEAARPTPPAASPTGPARLSTRLLMRLPPARRLVEALRGQREETARLAAEVERLSAEVAALRRRGEG